MVTCTRRIEWDATHRIPQLDHLGRVIDFGVVRVRLWETPNGSAEWERPA